MKRLIARFDNRSRIIKKTSIVARDGEIFRKELHLFYGTSGEANDPIIALYKAKIVQIAKACFPNWSDAGNSFAQKSFPQANAFSLFFNSNNEIVGFNL